MKQKASPFKDRDLTKRLLFPTISWSSMNAFLSYDREAWYNSYVLGIRSEPNEYMKGGIAIGERWERDKTFLPSVERPEIFEQELEATFAGLHIVGHLDGLHLKKKKKLQELKTSVSDKTWTHSKVKKWGQIDFYLFLLWLNYGIKPEEFEVELIYVPMEQNIDFEVVQRGEPVVLKTTRTLAEVLVFATKVKKTYKEMQDFIHNKQLTDITHI